MLKVLVTGATGLLGCSLVPHLKQCGYDVVGLGNSRESCLNIDLTEFDSCKSALDSINPQYIINLVALTNVDLCESQPHTAYSLNVKVVENLASWINASRSNCHLIHISSDHLYDGLGPHPENQLTIRNQYAMSKLAGEFAAQIVSSTILRTNFFGKSRCRHRSSLSDWVFESLIQSHEINVFTDVFFSPLSTHSLCSYIEKCIHVRPLGVFNLGSRNGMSKADFAFSMANALEMSASCMSRASSIDVLATPTCRPSDMRMNVSKFEAELGLELPELISEIYLSARDYKLKTI